MIMNMYHQRESYDSDEEEKWCCLLHLHNLKDCYAKSRLNISVWQRLFVLIAVNCSADHSPFANHRLAKLIIKSSLPLIRSSRNHWWIYEGRNSMFSATPVEHTAMLVSHRLKAANPSVLLPRCPPQCIFFCSASENVNNVWNVSGFSGSALHVWGGCQFYNWSSLCLWVFFRSPACQSFRGAAACSGGQPGEIPLLSEGQPSSHVLQVSKRERTPP